MSPLYCAIDDADRLAVLALLRPLVRPVELIADAQFLCFPVAPVPMQRARARGEGFVQADGRVDVQVHHYTPAHCRVAKNQLGDAFAQIQPRPISFSNLALVAIFYMPDRRRVDGDNLLKLVMDAGTQARVWQDDSQITRKTGDVELDAARPRTLIGVCPTTGSLDRTIPIKKRRGPMAPLHQSFLAGR